MEIFLGLILGMLFVFTMFDFLKEEDNDMTDKELIDYLYNKRKKEEG